MAAISLEHGAGDDVHDDREDAEAGAEGGEAGAVTAVRAAQTLDDDAAVGFLSPASVRLSFQSLAQATHYNRL